MNTKLALPKIGKPAPPISLPDLTGAHWDLNDRHGNKVVVIFHRHIH